MTDSQNPNSPIDPDHPFHTMLPQLYANELIPHKQKPEIGESASLQDLISILKRRRMMILGCILSCWFIGWIYGKITPKVYTATATLEIGGYSPLITSIGAEKMYGADTRKENYLKTTVRKLEGSGVADEVLSNGDLVEKLDELNNENDTMQIDRFISLSETIDKISVSDHITDLFTKEASLNSEETALGKELYLNMYTAQMHSDPEMRERSRNWLQSRAESKNGSWIDLWSRLAIGHSYLRESALADDDTACSLGVIQLLHASLRFGDNYPLLAQFARRSSAEALRKRARYEEAAEIFLGIDD